MIVRKESPILESCLQVSARAHLALAPGSKPVTLTNLVFLHKSSPSIVRAEAAKPITPKLTRGGPARPMVDSLRENGQLSNQEAVLRPG